jgi:hypothetical protein
VDSDSTDSKWKRSRSLTIKAPKTCGALLLEVKDCSCLRSEVKGEGVRSQCCFGRSEEGAGLLSACECGVLDVHDGVGGLGGFVYGDENTLVGLGAGVKGADVYDNVLVGVEELLISGLESGMRAAESEEGLKSGEGLLLLGSAGGCGEGIVLSWAKAAGEVAAVVGIFAATHGDLVAGVDLGHAAHGGEDGEGELESMRCYCGVVEEASGIVIAHERDEALGVGVEIVETKDIGELRHGCVFEKDVAEGEV